MKKIIYYVRTGFPVYICRNQKKLNKMATQIHKENHHHQELENFEKAEHIVKDYYLWAGAAGIIPVPFLDTAAIAAFQLRMIQKIGEVYGYKLSKVWVRAVIGSLTASFITTSIGHGIAKQIVKSIPVVGGFASLILTPGLAAASTYALGQIFILDFESDRSLLSLSADEFVEAKKDGFKAKLESATAIDNATATKK